ncbi:Glyoxalase-like domain-containing protein [Actinopolyspora mzabensis]|uniref:Glyoxalase-like domain-containing protein n=1 Tax=Actinopolyspora mzabensis TaxID=995066 RepID=A0A1G9AYG2_ACTMZ|nr:VOC family protein [Actinopolyspora mzabensis]SDK32287.1 Glyoxalase-like domain-containing protein [Actinopolyspora mzabensis]
MRISTVEHHVSDLAAAVAFYRDLLGLPVSYDEGSARVTLGSSELWLTPGPATAAAHHLAFDVPAENFDAAVSWLAERVPLLRSADTGEHEIEGPAGWNSRSAYFTGPDGEVLELIARRRVRHRPAPEGFGPEHIASISEVAIAVDDVSATAAELGRRFGLTSFGPSSETFGPVGEEAGLLILMRTGRAMAPDRVKHSAPLPLTVWLADVGTAGKFRPSDACTVVID